VSAATFLTRIAATIHNFITARFQSFFSLSPHTSITIRQGGCQCRDDFFAAAAVFAKLIADFIGCFFSDIFIGVVQAID